MESESSTAKIDKLDNSNYHYWKIRIEHLLILKDLENFLYEDPLMSTLQLQPKSLRGGGTTKRFKLSLALVSLTTYSKTSGMLPRPRTCGFLLKTFLKDIRCLINYLRERNSTLLLCLLTSLSFNFQTVFASFQLPSSPGTS